MSVQFPIMLVYAQSATQVAENFVDRINQAILFPLITLMLAVALLFFLYGCFEYIMGADNESARSQGRSHILYGIIGMFVMVAAYTILSIAAGTFGIDAV